MNEILPPERVILDKHDPSHKQAFEQYMQQRESYKPAPTGKMDVAQFREANSENLHLAANVPAEIASDPQQPAAVRLKASEIIRDNALGKDAVSQVNVQINLAPSPGDDEIIARFMRKRGIVLDNE